MTQAQIYAGALAKARASSNYFTDAQKLLYLNEAVSQFSRDIGGWHTTIYPEVTAYFDLQSHFGFSLSIDSGAFADVAVTDTDTLNMTGTTAAAELEDQLQAVDGDFTVAWSNFGFTVTHASKDFEIASVIDTDTYVDYTGELGLLGSSSSFVLAGDFPEGCTVKAPLGNSFYSIDSVVYDKIYQLTETDLNTVVGVNYTGTVSNYHIRDGYIYLYPAPSEMKMLEIYGRVDGTAWTDGGADPGDIPAKYHPAYMYYMAALMLEETMEYEQALTLRSLYFSIVKDARHEKGLQKQDLGVGPKRAIVKYTVNIEGH